MLAIIFAVVIGGWLLLIAGQLDSFWQVGTYILSSWFLLAALWNAWFFARED